MAPPPLLDRNRKPPESPQPRVKPAVPRAPKRFSSSPAATLCTPTWMGRPRGHLERADGSGLAGAPATKCPLSEVQPSARRPLLAGWGATACGGHGGIEELPPPPKVSGAQVRALVQEDRLVISLASRQSRVASTLLRFDAAMLLLHAEGAVPQGSGTKSGANRPLLAGWGAAITVPKRPTELVGAEAFLGAAEKTLQRRERAQQRAQQRARRTAHRTAQRTLRRWRLLVAVHRARLLPLRWVLSHARELISRWQKASWFQKSARPRWPQRSDRLLLGMF